MYVIVFSSKCEQSCNIKLKLEFWRDCLLPHILPQFAYLCYHPEREVVLSCCHGSKIFGWQQTENSLNKEICTVSNFIDLIQFHLICQMLAKFSGVESKTAISEFRKRKENFLSCVHLPAVKRAHEIRKFHVAVVQWWLKNMQKSMMCTVLQYKLMLFCHSCCCRHRCCQSSLLLWSKNFDTMVMWCHTSLY